MARLFKRSFFFVTVILFVLIHTSYKSLGQTWGLIGTNWYYKLENVSTPYTGYIQSTIVADSLLLTDTCKILISSYVSDFGIEYNQDTSYLFKKNGKIFHFRSGQFYTLYDFNSMPGDSWQVSVPYSSPWAWTSGNSTDTIVTVIVDSISTTFIDGYSKKLLYVHSVNNDWIFLNPIIEDIGSVGGFFPFIYGWQDFEIPFLRCYLDSNIYYNSSNIPCDTVISSIGDIHDIAYTLYPNPTSGNCKLIIPNTINHSLLIRIANIYGEVLYTTFEEKTQDLVSFNLEKLIPGSYFLIISSVIEYKVIPLIIY